MGRFIIKTKECEYGVNETITNIKELFNDFLGFYNEKELLVYLIPKSSIIMIYTVMPEDDIEVVE